MKLISFGLNGVVAAGILYNNRVVPFREIDPSLPDNMLACLDDFADNIYIIKQALDKGSITTGYAIDEIRFLAPLPDPPTFRDGYAFRAHVEAARRNRNVPMIDAFDEYPIFYFGNTSNVFGPGEISFMPDHFNKLDYELEVAIVIGRAGKNIAAENAHAYIAGMMILNDWSARTLQMEEMLLNLGPAKGKDLGCSFGPAIVTMDELQHRETTAPSGHRGKAWQLTMRGYINDVLMSEGNLSDMSWTFGEIIERASYGVMLRPGDIIGSGTVGTGCLLELNGTNKTNDWLKENDVVRFDVDVLGSLENTIRRENTEHSLFTLKSNYVKSRP